MFHQNTVYILFTKITRELPSDLYEKYLFYLPNSLRAQHSRYRRWQDRAANLFSKMLLIKGLEKFGYDHSSLGKLQYTAFGRPFLPDNIDFNISHSGQYALCAVAAHTKVGIDIEEIKDVDFSEFEDLMTTAQWQVIKASANPLRTFFRFWAIKESIIKADGRGLSIPLKEIIIQNDEAFFENKWYLKELKFDENYCANLAVGIENSVISIEYVDFSNNY